MRTFPEEPLWASLTVHRAAGESTRPVMMASETATGETGGLCGPRCLPAVWKAAHVSFFPEGFCLRGRYRPHGP